MLETKKESVKDVSKNSGNQKNISKPDFIKWFSELDKNSGNVAGGKGANLGEIYNLKVPVPSGFVITAQAYDYLIKTAGIEEKINELSERINYEDENGLNEITSEIRELIEKIKFPEEMEKEIYDAYEDLSAGADEGFQKSSAHEILKKSPEDAFVAVRSSATTEDLADASFAGQQETYLNVKGKNDLIKSIKKCFSSLFTPRATFYRNRKGFKHSESKIAVIIQKMIDSDKSGVIFSKDPSTGESKIVLEAVWGLGEGIVSGKITPDKYVVDEKGNVEETEVNEKKIAITRNSGGDKNVVKLSSERSKRQVLKNYEIKKLADMALKLEEHYEKPQDIEFAIEGEEIFIVQTRPITTVQGKPKETKSIKGTPILKGLAASPGIASGKIKIIKDMKDLNKIREGDVLVTGMTNPDMVVSMQKSSAIVTDEGGLTAHAAIVSREMGIPAIVGTQNATTKLKEGEVITVDGFTGKIYKGKVSEDVEKEVLPVTSKTKTKIKVILDLPSFAERAAETGLKGVGLARLEGIIAENGKHPEYYLKKGHMGEYTQMIARGIRKIAKHFNEIWVRTSDIRSDEFSNLKGAPQIEEANPMLGMHGIRYGMKNPEILKAELKALKQVVNDKNLGEVKIGILLPQVINVFEVEETKKFLEEIDFKDAKLGIMIETPASVQLIPEFCKLGIDFISFGTNDLTQYILAVDRGNSLVQGLYDEMHPAILYQLEYVIRVAKRNDVETSICGQAGSKKPMVKYLVEKGINSISVNADVAKEISDYIYELENGESPEEEIKNNEEKDSINEKDFVPLQKISEENTEEKIEEIPETEKETEEKIKSHNPANIESEDLPEINGAISEKLGELNEKESKEDKILDIF